MKKEKVKRVTDLRSVELVEVIMTKRLIGDGEIEPYRMLTEYWSLEGKLLAESDDKKEIDRQITIE